VVEADAPGILGEGDALVSHDTPVGVKTADCLPILIADPVQKAFAAVHAGWRGTVERVAANAVSTMRELYGSHAADLILALGPGIRACCFEVGPEVAGEFRNLFPERKDLDQRVRVDLEEANMRILEEQGVARAQVDVSGLCTKCGDGFHSYRRDRQESGRMLSYIGPA
jgi:YfiH family protein